MYEYKYSEDYKHKHAFVGYKEAVLSTLFWKYQGHDNQV